MMRIGRCNPNVNVIPCININHTHHISALLTNGDVITGQSQISHPSKPSINRLASRHNISSKGRNDIFEDITNIQNDMAIDFGSYLNHPETKTPQTETHMSSPNNESMSNVYQSIEKTEEGKEEEEEEYADPVYILPELKNSQLHFAKKDTDNLLSSSVKRILYTVPYEETIKPTANIRAFAIINTVDIRVFFIGSLMTSILPIIILFHLYNTII